MPTEYKPAGSNWQATQIGAWAGTPGSGIFFLFAGMLYDAAAGLYLTKTRAYNPRTGRFLQRDKLDEDPKDGYDGFIGGKDALGSNLYLWTDNNPVTKVDPAGMWPWDAAANWVKGKVSNRYNYYAARARAAWARMRAFKARALARARALQAAKDRAIAWAKAQAAAKLRSLKAAAIARARSIARSAAVARAKAAASAVAAKAKTAATNVVKLKQNQMQKDAQFWKGTIEGTAKSPHFGAFVNGLVGGAGMALIGLSGASEVGTLGLSSEVSIPMFALGLSMVAYSITTDVNDAMQQGPNDVTVSGLAGDALMFSKTFGPVAGAVTAGYNGLYAVGEGFVNGWQESYGND